MNPSVLYFPRVLDVQALETIFDYKNVPFRDFSLTYKPSTGTHQASEARRSWTNFLSLTQQYRLNEWFLGIVLPGLEAHASTQGPLLQMPDFEFLYKDLKMIKYDPGGYFKRHVDGTQRYLGNQRTDYKRLDYYTVIMCLEAPAQGGELVLYHTESGRAPETFQYCQGDVLIFKKGIPHEARPVCAGTKLLLVGTLQCTSDYVHKKEAHRLTCSQVECHCFSEQEASSSDESAEEDGFCEECYD